MSTALLPFVGGALEALRPVTAALGEPRRFRALMAQLGYDVPLDAETLARLEWAGDFVELIEQAEALARDLRAPSDGGVLDLIGLVQSIVELIDGLDDPSSLVEGGTAPEVLGDPAFWADVAGALPGLTLTAWLERHQPILHGVLRLAGVVEDRAMPATQFRRAHSRQALAWDRLGALATDPAGAIADNVGWGGSDFDHALLLGELARALRRLGMKARRPPVDARFVGTGAGALIAPGHAERWTLRGLAMPFLSGLGPWGEGYIDLGLLAYPAPRTPAGAVDGLYVTVLADTGYEAAVGLGGAWTLTLGGELSATGAVGVRIHPGDAAFVGGEPDASVVLALDGAPAVPWRLLGGATGPRVEADTAHLALEMHPGADAELRLAAELTGLRVVIEPGEGDALMRTLLGEASATVELDGSLAWSSRTGFELGGQVGLAARIPIDKQLGIVHLDRIDVALLASGAGAALEAGVTGSALIGPATLTATNVGLRLLLEPASDGDGVFGNLGIGLGLRPPDGVGLDFDLEVGGGGGFLWLDPDIGRYAGGFSVEFLEVGLSALGVVDTQLPGDPDGWALFASLSATFPGLPLGFGFLLTGVGGIFALNRTMDVEALATGIKSGAADAIMFPDDPATDVLHIVEQLDAWFPIAEGSSVFGVDAQLAWGSGGLVTAELGVLISFPDLDLVILGTIESVLPDEETAELELHMDSLGVIDLSEGTVWVTAALYDSSLAQTIHVSGGMAMYGRFTADPFFLLSVGGYHPSFQPPGGLPGAVLDVDRMRAEVAISDDVSFSLEAYFAVTSNTLQFGAEAALEASARFLGVTYTARGEVGFDVLLVFSPFAFVVDFEASVTVTAGSSDKELLAVGLGAHLEGPKPWYASGYGRFTFIGVDVRFEFEVGGNSPDEAPPEQDVLELVRQALEAPDAWRATAPATNTVLAEEATVAGEVWARPDATLEAIQDVAPLNRELDHFGQYEILGERTLTITGAGVDGAGALPWEEGISYFAPAQYDDLTRAEKLSAPSYEPMTAGVRFGIDEIALPPQSEARTVSPVYERAVVDGEKTLELKSAPLEVAMEIAAAGHLAGAGAVTADAGPFAAEPVEWCTVDAVTGKATGPTGTYRSALAGLEGEPRGSLRIAPAYAAREG